MTNPSDAFDTPNPSGLPEVLDRPHRPVNMVAGTIGHFVEWYDWYIYGLLAAVFAGQIFPSHSPFASLIAALLTYAIGFVVRPFSGIIISPLADRYGRRVDPDPVRLRDGARLPDHCPHPWIRHDRLRGTDPLRHRPHPAGHLGRQRAAKRHLVHGRTRPTRTGEACSAPSPTWQAASRPSPRPVPPRSSPQSSPRRPSPPGVGASRSSSAASSAWSVSSCGQAPTRPPNSRPVLIVDKKSAPARLWALLREHPKALLQTAALSAPAVAYYTWATFLPTYASLTTGRNTASTLTGSVIGLALLVIVVPICGALSDRLGRRKIFPIIGAIGMIVLFYPLLLLLNRPGFWVYVVGCRIRMGRPGHLAGGIPDHSGRAVPGLGPGIRHRFLAPAGHRHLRWHRPTDRRRVRRRRTSHVGRHLHDRHRRSSASSSTSRSPRRAARPSAPPSPWMTARSWKASWRRPPVYQVSGDLIWSVAFIGWGIGLRR